MPLPRFLKRRPVQLLAALLALATIATLGRNSEDDSPAGAVSPEATAVLVVDDMALDFDLDTCFVGNDSFVVAGHGVDDGEDFRVLASPSDIELAFGITDQAAHVPDDSLWLGTSEAFAWSAVDTSVVASVELVDRRGEDNAGHNALLRVDCGASS